VRSAPASIRNNAARPDTGAMPAVRPRLDARVDAELDDPLATLQRGDLSPLELRILLSLTDRDFAQPELAAALGTPPRSIGPAVRHLAARGLIRCRFERGRHSTFILSVTPGGPRALAPVAEGHREAP
jgi:DNA-binding MarR family transcriptional regulator